jgi:hypothetical protein
MIKLGVAAVTEKFEEAFRLIRKLGHDEEFKKEHYRDWPIFRELRKQPGFSVCYRDIYSDDFEQATVVAAGPTIEVSPKQLPAPLNSSDSIT